MYVYSLTLSSVCVLHGFMIIHIGDIMLGLLIFRNIYFVNPREMGVKYIAIGNRSYLLII